MKRANLPVFVLVLLLGSLFFVDRETSAEFVALTTTPSFDFLPIISKSLPTPTFTPTPLPTATQLPTATPQPTATPTRQPPSGCSICSYDAYNCSDFSRQVDAQACYNYCYSLVGYDVHRLDRDGDGVACDSLPLDENAPVWPVIQWP